MGETLRARVDAIQQASGSHAVDLTNEMALVRCTAQDVLKQYADAVELHAMAGDGPEAAQARQLVVDCGAALRSVIREIRDMAVSVCNIERLMRDLHDPQVTYALIMQVVDVVEDAIRTAEVEGRLSTLEANDIMAIVARDVDEKVRLPNEAPAEFTGPSRISPDQAVSAMDATVPLCAG